MTVHRAATDDLDWMTAVLMQRRQPLVKEAPIFWRPAPEARAHHRAFIEHLITAAGANAYRTTDSVLLAAPRREGWLVDDFHVPDELWNVDGCQLWGAFATDCRGSSVRFVCPTYERHRAEFARAAGLTLEESWWLREMNGVGGGAAGVQVHLSGAGAVIVAAPPIYAPPGPILFLPTVTDPEQALPDAIKKSSQLGCAAIVVNQRDGDARLVSMLGDSGFRRHCDYLVGDVRPF